MITITKSLAFSHKCWKLLKDIRDSSLYFNHKKKAHTQRFQVQNPRSYSKHEIEVIKNSIFLKSGCCCFSCLNQGTLLSHLLSNKIKKHMLSWRLLFIFYYKRKIKRVSWPQNGIYLTSCTTYLKKNSRQY